MFTCIAVFVGLHNLIAQSDSLALTNNRHLVGEIKSMDKGVIVIETSYSKDDFRVKWSEVVGVFTSRPILINTSEGKILYGSINSPSTGQLAILTKDAGEVIVSLENVVYIKPVDKGFKDRLSGGLDLGYTMTRTRNQRQFSVRSRLGYLAEKWYANAAYNTLQSKQDDVEDISRTDGYLTYVRILPKDWFVLARLDFLHNTEQRLDLRLNTKLGGGKFLVRTNKMNWSVLGGASFNNENFWGEVDDRQSAESWIGTQLNLFDMGDLSLLSNGFVYPSLTESGRLRVDYSLDLKYDLPLDFYVKTGFTINYDNQPAAGASRSDYVWQTTFGWSW